MPTLIESELIDLPILNASAMKIQGSSLIALIRNGTNVKTIRYINPDNFSLSVKIVSAITDALKKGVSVMNFSIRSSESAFDPNDPVNAATYIATKL